ncbi:MAG: ParB N-terminal domain-containing protein [Deltaproteobacteria bacterium]|nr:ParB N-terminal domain-containing protein [Deltaproteobacteria bacterium]
MMKKNLLKSSLVNIAISDIDLTPGPFCMSFHFNLEPLKASIEKYGVINPPYLLRNPDNNFLVVAGYARLMAVIELGWHDIVCHVLPDSFSRFNALLFNLNDNLIHRQFNTIEKGMILQRLTCFISTEEIVTNFMPILGIPSNKQQLELFLGLDELEERIKISIAIEQLSIRVAGLLRHIDKNDRLKINNLFTSLKWSFNQQWETIQWIKEIASREGCSINKIINSKDINEVLHNTTMNKPQKVKAIVRILKFRRFPSLSKAEKLFIKGVSNLSLPLGVKIIPPPFFEGTDYKLEVTFRKGEDLKEKLANLCNVPELKHIPDFWKGI